MFAVFGTSSPGKMAHSCRTIPKSWSTCGLYGFSGWMKNMPHVDHDFGIVHMRLVRLLGMDDEHADLTHHFLHGGVRVVEERAFLVKSEFVGELLARSNRHLADVRRSIHFDRDFDTVPMDGRGFGQSVLKDDADAVALPDLDGRTRTTAVVPPDGHVPERNEFPLNRLRSKPEDFDSPIHFVGKIGNVRRLHRKRGDWTART